MGISLALIIGYNRRKTLVKQSTKALLEGPADEAGTTVDKSGQIKFFIGPQVIANFRERTNAAVGVGLPIYQT